MTKKQKTILFGGLLLLFLLVVVQLAWAALGQSIADISETRTDAGFPALAISPDRMKIGIVWAERWEEEDKEGQAVQGPIFFRGAIIEGGPNDGLPDPKVEVDDSNKETDQSSQPDIASDPNSNNQMHVIWLNVSGPLGGQTEKIIYKQCTITPADCGDVNVATEIFSETSNNTSLNAPAIATSAGATTGVHAVWRQSNILAQTEEILFSTRQAGGAWTAPVNISGAFNGADQPSIVAATGSDLKNYLHVVFVNDNNDVDILSDEIVYVRGEVVGSGVVSWGAPMIVPGPETTAGNPASVPDYPTVMASGDTVVIVWDVFAGTPAQFPNRTNEEYYAVYNVSGSNGGVGSFSIPALDIGTDEQEAGQYSARRSDNDEAVGIPAFHSESVQGRRLQLRATFVPTTTPTISGTLHVVWHETTDEMGSPSAYHDIFYTSHKIGNCGPPCTEWIAPVNETDNALMKKVFEQRSYSAAADIAFGANGALHGVYTESNEEGGFKLDQVIWNIVFSSSVPDLTITRNPTPTPLGDPTVYLPMISKP